LNQYTNRTVPGYVDVQGGANSSATVTVDGNSAYQKGSYFREELAVGNSGGPVYLTVTNAAALGTNTVTWMRNVLVAGTPETYGYDLDGNLTNDGKWNYTWDGENRLITVQSIATIPAAAGQRFDYAYDYQGRRIYQKQSVWDSGTSSYREVTEERCWYDGWNLIGRSDLATGNVQAYVWGLDLSGSQQGAGGVGGLLMLDDVANGSYFYSYDGNGNVVGLMNVNDGTIAAQYEYGPFGEMTKATGPMAFNNPVRFSTKFEDEGTGMLYYGYRYYNPGTGRWLSRDPMEEGGGRNLYSFISNGGASLIDTDGRQILLATPLEATLQTAAEFGARTITEEAPRITIPGESTSTTGNTGGPGTTIRIYPPPPPETGTGTSTMPRLFPPVPITQPQSAPNPQTQPTQPGQRADDQEGRAPHAGEWHIQFAGREKQPWERVIWRRQNPLTKAQGLARLDVLWASMNPRLKSDLGDDFNNARSWVQSRPTSGVPAFFVQSWPKNAGRCWHLDVEVVTGVAFIDDPTPRIGHGLMAIIPPLRW
jgi:RHS repeat-associated protein